MLASLPLLPAIFFFPLYMIQKYKLLKVLTSKIYLAFLTSYLPVFSNFCCRIITTTDKCRCQCVNPSSFQPFFFFLAVGDLGLAACGQEGRGHLHPGNRQALQIRTLFLTLLNVDEHIVGFNLPAGGETRQRLGCHTCCRVG